MASAACYRPPLYLYGSNTPVDGSGGGGGYVNALYSISSVLFFSRFKSLFSWNCRTVSHQLHFNLYFLNLYFRFSADSTQRAEPFLQIGLFSKLVPGTQLTPLNAGRYLPGIPEKSHYLIVSVLFCMLLVFLFLLSKWLWARVGRSKYVLKIANSQICEL